MSNTITTVELAESRRTEYRDGGVLSASALAGDSAANVSAWEKHQTSAHTGGIVAGLFVTFEEGQPLKVSPGAAIDFLGRMLLLAAEWSPSKQSTRTEDFAVWLQYAAKEVPGNQSDLNRYDETPQLDVLDLSDSVSACELPVMNGVLLAIVRKGKVDNCCRRYVGAVGSRIDAPSKRASVVLGPQSARDSRRFAIGVQADPTQTIRDVFTWESTGTIRFSATTPVAAPEEKQKPDRIDQPPIMCVGSPTVNVTPEDILDPCRIWSRLRIEDKRRAPIQPELLGALSHCDRVDLTTPSACRDKLTALLVRALNQLIRKASDYAIDAAKFDYLIDAEQMKYEPVEGDAVLDMQGNTFIVSKVDISNETCDLTGGTGSPTNVGWSKVLPLHWFPAFIRTLDGRHQKLLSCWRRLPGEYVCRILLDEFLGDAIRPLEARPRGLYFRGSAAVDPEPPASRIHLADFKKDGETYRQLRITIQDPGKENSPHRYRCSIGTATDCTDPPAPIPGPDGNIWNRQTSLPRGILSVLADKSIDIHKGLNVWAREGTIDAGLILKLAPAEAGGGASTGAGGTTGLPLPTTPILNNAVLWDGQRVRRASPGSIEIGGSLHNLTDVMIESIQILVTIYGQHDTTHEPIHKPVITGATLDARMTKPISSLVTSPDLVVIFGDPFASGPIIVSLLVMGANQHNAIVCTQYREDL